MSCEIVPCVSSALAFTEFHSLSPPWVHSAETPGPLMPQPGALLAGRCIHDGFNCGSFCAVGVMPRMFSASYQRYSGRGESETGGEEEDAATRGRKEGDGETGGWGEADIRSPQHSRNANEATRNVRSKLTTLLAWLCSIDRAGLSFVPIDLRSRRSFYQSRQLLTLSNTRTSKQGQPTLSFLRLPPPNRSICFLSVRDTVVCAMPRRCLNKQSVMNAAFGRPSNIVLRSGTVW